MVVLISCVLSQIWATYTKAINVIATNTGVAAKAIEINGAKYKFDTDDMSSVRINVINSDINIRFMDVGEYERVGWHSFFCN